ncbi:hypothetical protein [Roseibium sp. RKSG952]|uniref:hypothetical protein n=1 Tax=Roseibium sp. RKSG952 TaxID=2529384 RepID=UPI0012BBB799|nr:hypothetical protein [Roseibium sp. RKSG952]MTH95674.1 hypothetical protein [Roseibium sp. RKSG952]
MLIDDFKEFETGMTYPSGYRHDQSLGAAKKRISEAEIFVLDQDAVAMAAGVALSKPSSTLAALPWIRLPFERIWVEFSNRELREAMANLGSPNKRPPATVSEIVKTGFLVRRDKDCLVIEYIHEDKVDGRKMIDLCPVYMTFDLDTPDILAEEDIPQLDDFKLDTMGARGRVQRHMKAVHEDPREAHADKLLKSRYRWVPHPDMAIVRKNLVAMAGEAIAAEAEGNQAREMRLLVNLVLIPILILMSCPNAIATHAVSHEKLNKNRRKKGKPELSDYKLVKMSLSKSRRRVVEGAAVASGARTVSGSLVMGHFKVRKTGVFWWNPHSRAGTIETPGRRTMVTR